MDVHVMERDYFTDRSLLSDPYAFFESVREKGPIAFFGDPPYAIVTA